MKLYRLVGKHSSPAETDNSNFTKLYLAAMSLLAWLAVLTGTYAIYPWYRSTPPSAAMDLAGYPQKLLMSQPTTSGWHAVGMEWKEHVAWLVPITITMATVVVAQYGRNLSDHPRLRAAVFQAVILSFVSACLAGFWGAMINKYGPVTGGNTIVITDRATRW